MWSRIEVSIHFYLGQNTSKRSLITSKIGQNGGEYTCSVRSRKEVSIHSVRSRSIFQGIGLISLSYRSNTPNQSYGNDSGKLV